MSNWDWRERFHAFFLEYVQEEAYPEAEEVRNVRQEERNSGGCETCAFDYEAITFEYRVGDAWRGGEVMASFAELFEKETP